MWKREKGERKGGEKEGDIMRGEIRRIRESERLETITARHGRGGSHSSRL